MAYEIEFTAKVSVTDDEAYINDCCWGADVIRDRLLPVLSTNMYDSVRTGQEDWGWYIWMRRAKELTRVHIQCDNKEDGLFRIHVYSSIKKWLHWTDINLWDVERTNKTILVEIKKWGALKRVEKFTPDFIAEL